MWQVGFRSDGDGGPAAVLVDRGLARYDWPGFGVVDLVAHGFVGAAPDVGRCEAAVAVEPR